MFTLTILGYIDILYDICHILWVSHCFSSCLLAVLSVCSHHVLIVLPCAFLFEGRALNIDNQEENNKIIIRKQEGDVGGRPFLLVLDGGWQPWPWPFL